MPLPEVCEAKDAYMQGYALTGSSRNRIPHRFRLTAMTLGYSGFLQWPSALGHCAFAAGTLDTANSRIRYGPRCLFRRRATPCMAGEPPITGLRVAHLSND